MGLPGGHAVQREVRAAVVIDWDAWRAAYPLMDVPAQRAFHSRVYEAYPCQSHFSREPLLDALREADPRTVVELGGWDGEAAITMLEQLPRIERWTNYEICGEAVENGHRHERYVGTALQDEWFWDHQRRADVLVACHVIEHLSSTDLERLFRAADVTWIYLEAPLTDSRSSWWGSPTSHVLELSWPEVDAMLADLGFQKRWARELALPPSSGDRARGCCYRREPA